MKRLFTLSNPTKFGLALFVAAAMLLLSVIFASKMGHVAIADILIQIAGPVSAMAMATLATLAFSKPTTDLD